MYYTERSDKLWECRKHPSIMSQSGVNMIKHTDSKIKQGRHEANMQTWLWGGHCGSHCHPLRSPCRCMFQCRPTMSGRCAGSHQDPAAGGVTCSHQSLSHSSPIHIWRYRCVFGSLVHTYIAYTHTLIFCIWKCCDSKSVGLGQLAAKHRRHWHHCKALCDLEWFESENHLSHHAHCADPLLCAFLSCHVPSRTYGEPSPHTCAHMHAHTGDSCD